MEKINKVLRVKGQHGHNVNVLREQYLREDIPCGSPRCLAGCKNNTGNPLLNQLSDTAAHYVVPDIGVICDYLEVLELPELTSIVITQTVMHHVKHESGSRHYNRVQSLVRNPQKFSVVFHNEFQRYAYCSRKPGESKSDWQNRSVYEAALWYHNHLVQRTPIVMLTEHQQVIAEYGNKTIGLFVMSVSEYLESFWNHLEGAYQLYESLSASLAVTKSREEYSVHLPVSELNTGVQTGRFVQGRLNVNKHNAQQEAFLSPSGTTTKAEESDILIYGLVDRQRAVHGDSVVVELLPTASWKSRSKALHDKTESSGNPETDADFSSTVMPTGRVVGIIKRNWRVYVASLPQEDSTAGSRKSAKILVIPWDRRIPKIRIGTSQAVTLKYDRILVRIDGWEMDSQYPHGHFVKSLGRAGDLETEIATILHENELSACPFAEKQISELPVNNSEHPWQMTFDDIKKRRDLRYSHLVFSIDPKGCEDVDDTLSIRKLPDKNLELGVHIADVTHFVPAGSLTDLEAQSRSTTVYLADRRHDMIPTILSANLCSLLSEVDRFAVSVIWTLNPDTYEVLDVWYGRTVIRSAYKLFYEMAQEISEGTSVENMVENIPELRAYRGNELNEKVSELRWCISELMSFARHTQATRTQGGAVQLEGVEVQVQLNKDKDIQDLLPKQPLEVHETIAECMIFANHWVAKKIYQTYPTHSVLRQHPLPRQTHFTELRRCAGSCGFQIDTDSNKTLAESLDACVVANDPVVNKVLRSLATQAMSQAEYLSTGSAQTFSHYGLALEYYTHFTSPIRRYADILVHRLLLASVGESTETLSLIQGKQLEEIAQHMNNKHRASQSAQKQSLELFQCLYFTSHVDNNSVCLADAVICQLRPNGVLVFVPRYGIKGAVYLRHRDGLVAYRDKSGADTEWCSGTITVRDHYLTVDSVYGEQQYTLFDHITVRVHIETTHAHGSQIKLHLVDNQPYISHIEETPTTHSKHQLIQDVRDNADTIVQERDELRLGPNYNDYKSLYGQTTDPTFYTMLTRLKEHSLTYDGEP